MQRFVIIHCYKLITTQNVSLKNNFIVSTIRINNRYRTINRVLLNYNYERISKTIVNVEYSDNLDIIIKGE